MNNLLKAAQAVIISADSKLMPDDVPVIVGTKEIEALRQAVEKAKGVEAVSEFQYKGATISGSAKDVAAVQEILASEPEEPIDALIAEIDAIPREGEVDYDGIFMMERDDGEYLSYDAVMAAVDKYRARSGA